MIDQPLYDILARPARSIAFSLHTILCIVLSHVPFDQGEIVTAKPTACGLGVRPSIKGSNLWHTENLTPPHLVLHDNDHSAYLSNLLSHETTQIIHHDQDVFDTFTLISLVHQHQNVHRHRHGDNRSAEPPLA